MFVIPTLVNLITHRIFIPFFPVAKMKMKIIILYLYVLFYEAFWNATPCILPKSPVSFFLLYAYVLTGNLPVQYFSFVFFWSSIQPSWWLLSEGVRWHLSRIWVSSHQNLISTATAFIFNTSWFYDTVIEKDDIVEKDHDDCYVSKIRVMEC